MTWREFWQSTAHNLRNLFGARPPGDRERPALPDSASSTIGWQAPGGPARPRGAAALPPAQVESEAARPDTRWIPADPDALDSAPPLPPLDARAQTAPTAAAVSEAADGPAEPADPAVAETPPDAQHPDPPAAPAAILPETAPAPPPREEPLVLTTILEGLLFVAGEPVAAADLARALDLPEAEILEGLTHLANHYRASGRGLRVQVFGGKYQLVTAPAAAGHIEAFLNLETTTRLSTPALETLAVIAYRQPVTRAQIEAIRGVDCAGVLRSLTQRGLVVETGRLETVGRPILYGVTELFMQHFGLSEMAELPPLEAGDADRLWAASVVAEDEPAARRPIPAEPQASDKPDDSPR
jgi:segregation and condensation protein B